MGVKDLWKLLEPAGKPVDLDSLQGVVLAVDVSIWLNQAVKGMRDRHGDPLPQAHLLVLFHRVCKLLHYKIKPVFVFDGATPTLKKHTIAERSRKRMRASQRSVRAMDQQVSKFLQSKILERMYGDRGDPTTPPLTSDPPDMYQLPPLPDNNTLTRSPESSSPPTLPFVHTDHTHQVTALDIHSEDFNSLPPEVQHELLLERKEIETHSHHNPKTLPQVASDFSSYQLSKLIKQSRTTRRLQEVRQVLKSNETAVMGLSDESRVQEVETSRIISSEDAHYILVKGRGINSQSEDEDDRQERENDRGKKEEKKEYWSMDNSSEMNVVGMVEVKEHVDLLSEKSTAEEFDRTVDSDKTIADTNEYISVSQLMATSPVSHDSDPVPHDNDPVSHDNDPVPHDNDPVSHDNDPVVDTISDTNSSSPEPRDSICIEPPIEWDRTSPVDYKAPEISVSVLLQPPPLLVTTAGVQSPKQDSVSLQSLNKSHETNVTPPHHITVSPSQLNTKQESLAPDVGPVSPQESDNLDSDWDEDLLSIAPEEAQDRLREEVRELGRERSRQSRAAAAVSNTMYKEAQELFRLFGLPHLVAPGEAEAQCAYLECSGQVEGILTDDNDVLLFGGKRVYRGFFSQDREPEVYSSSDIQEKLGLSRCQLVLLGYLLGCDYTAGLEGVGIVSAMELIRDFPGDGLEPLEKIRDWHGDALVKPAMVKQASGVLKKLSQSHLPTTFPEPAVYQAYFAPNVDYSAEEFAWGKPDLDLLRKFARDKINWDQAKVDSLLLPLLKRLNSEQKPISQFLSGPLAHQERKGIKSKRIRNVVACLTRKEPAPGSKRECNSSPTQPTKKPRVTRKRKSATKQASKTLQLTTISASSSDSD